MPSNTFELHLPKPGDFSQTVIVPNSGRIVIIGANGSGKTRLGSWLDQDSPQRERVHRISAQKSLSIPDTVSPLPLSKAQSLLWYGYGEAADNPNPWRYKAGHRWQNHPNSMLLDDFQRLLVVLYSDDYDQSTNYRQTARKTAGRIEPPETKIDTVKRLWEETLPYRKLKIGSAEIHTYTTGNPASSYKATEMSDGERVVFYLIGQVVAAPSDAVIVIDEPELHLHKSIQSKLWDAIEAQRTDCQFVYLTHDLDFATSRVGAPKVCARDFDGKNWDWFIAPTTGIPEEVLLQIIGSRKPVLFVEGEHTSDDQHIFSHVYPDYSVIGCGGCMQVINATIAFSAAKSLHHLECRGIVDRDFRSQKEVVALNERGISVLEVAELENLFLQESVIEQIAKDLLRGDDAHQIIEKIKDYVLSSMAKEREKLISGMAWAEVQSILRKFNGSDDGLRAVETSFEGTMRSIDIAAIYAKFEDQVNAIIEKKNYSDAIKIYSNKGMLAELASLFSTKRDVLVDHIHRLLGAGRGEELLVALRASLPSL